VVKAARIKDPSLRTHVQRTLSNRENSGTDEMFSEIFLLTTATPLIAQSASHLRMMIAFLRASAAPLHRGSGSRGSIHLLSAFA
jgi:hypothetical protein